MAPPRGGRLWEGTEDRPLQRSEGAQTQSWGGPAPAPEALGCASLRGLVAPGAVGVARAHRGVWGCVALRAVSVGVPGVYSLRSPCTLTSGHLGSTPAPPRPSLPPHLQSTGLRGPQQRRGQPAVGQRSHHPGLPPRRVTRGVSLGSGFGEWGAAWRTDGGRSGGPGSCTSQPRGAALGDGGFWAGGAGPAPPFRKQHPAPHRVRDPRPLAQPGPPELQAKRLGLVYFWSFNWLGEGRPVKRDLTGGHWEFEGLRRKESEFPFISQSRPQSGPAGGENRDELKSSGNLEGS